MGRGSPLERDPRRLRGTRTRQRQIEPLDAIGDPDDVRFQIEPAQVARDADFEAGDRHRPRRLRRQLRAEEEHERDHSFQHGSQYETCDVRMVCRARYGTRIWTRIGADLRGFSHYGSATALRAVSGRREPRKQTPVASQGARFRSSHRPLPSACGRRSPPLALVIGASSW